MSAIWAAALTGRNYGPDLSFPVLQVPVSSGRGRWRRPWPALFHSNHPLSELRGLVRRTGSLARERRRNRAALPALAAEPSLPTGGTGSARLLTVAQSSRLRRFTQALLDPREVSLPCLRLPSRRSMESSGPMPPLSVRSGADADALSDLGLMAPARWPAVSGVPAGEVRLRTCLKRRGAARPRTFSGKDHPIAWITSFLSTRAGCRHYLGADGQRRPTHANDGAVPAHQE